MLYASPPHRTAICESTKYQLADRHDTAADCAFKIEVPDTADTPGRRPTSDNCSSPSRDCCQADKKNLLANSSISADRQTKLLFHMPTHTGESKNQTLLNFRMLMEKTGPF